MSLNLLSRYHKSQSSRATQPTKQQNESHPVVPSVLPRLRTNTLRANDKGNCTVRIPHFRFDAKRTVSQSASNRSINSVPSPSLETRLQDLITQCRDMDVPCDSKGIVLRSKKADMLTKIFCIASNDQSIRSVSEKCRFDLFKMVSDTVIRVLPALPLVVIYSDEKVKPQTSENWMFLSIAHKIIQQMILNCDPKEVKEMLDSTFLTRYTSLLETEVAQEQVLVENTIIAIYDNVPALHVPLFNRILDQLRRYNDNPYIFPCVAPSLRIIIHFLKDVPRPFNKSYQKLFKEFIFPLAATQMSSEFFTSINKIGTIYYTDNMELSKWALRFMKKCWPKTDTKKVCAFIGHIPIIASYLPQNDMLNGGIIIFNLLGSSLSSYNFQVALAALSVIKTSGFLSTFGDYLGTLIPLLLRGVNICSHHWNPIVAKTSVEAARIIIAIKPEASTQEVIMSIEKKRTDREKTTKENWEAIQCLALENYKGDESFLCRQ